LRRSPERARTARLNYHFAPVPRRAVVALRDGQLLYDEFVVLAWLYDRAPRTTFVVRVTLRQISDGIGWTRSDDWLSKRLRRLRDRGWIGFDSQPGRNRHVYEIALVDARVLASEPAPSPRTSRRPSIPGPERRHESHRAPRDAREQSEPSSSRPEHDRPSVLPAGPSPKGDSQRLDKPHRDDSSAGPVRAPQRGSEQDKPLGKGEADSKERSSSRSGDGTRDTGDSYDDLLQLLRETDPGDGTSGSSS
jgi:hypothetical protein